IDKEPFREKEIMKGHICHIEIPADNLGSLQKFYGGLFDWNYEKAPGDFEYFGIKHGDEKPMAGMMTRQHPEQKPLFYVCVDSAEKAVEEAEGLGATVIVPRTPVRGYGWFAVLMDPQNNPFGLWQEDAKAA
ncbi:MAG TPA: VOC family protein, partial [Desulfomonilaceae bacterium]|nr:VOC family protein [Desulfomonilaceae bacterium]